MSISMGFADLPMTIARSFPWEVGQMLARQECTTFAWSLGKSAAAPHSRADKDRVHHLFF